MDNLLARFQLDFTRFQLDFSIPLKQAGLAILEKNYQSFVFRCVLASLYEGLSVRPTDGPAVRLLVRPLVRPSRIFLYHRNLPEIDLA